MNESLPPSLPVRKKSFFLKFALLLTILVLILGGLWWWFNRPIRPVVLTAEERAVVDAKIQSLQPPAQTEQAPAEPQYEKGSKEIVLTERELNGLLNQNTDLGKSLSFQLATGAVHARFETDLDPDLPVVGGKRLKARARFLVGSEPGQPALVLDDVTVWGISLPNDWLAGMKGQDLLGQAISTNGSIPGVEEFKVETGKLTIRLAE